MFLNQLLNRFRKPTAPLGATLVAIAAEAKLSTEYGMDPSGLFSFKVGRRLEFEHDGKHFTVSLWEGRFDLPSQDGTWSADIAISNGSLTSIMFGELIGNDHKPSEPVTGGHCLDHPRHRA